MNVLVNKEKQYSRLYVQIFDGSRVGVYEKPDVEHLMVTKIDLSKGRAELFGVEV